MQSRYQITGVEHNALCSLELMSQEVLIALVAAGGITLGATLAMLGNLVTGLLNRKTAREDREAAAEAASAQWSRTREAEREIWLRAEKQRIHLGFLEQVTNCKEAVYRHMGEIADDTDSESASAAHAGASRYLNELLLLAPATRHTSLALFGALTDLWVFSDENAAKFDDAMFPAWSNLRDKYAVTMGEYLHAANADLGANEMQQSGR